METNLQFTNEICVWQVAENTHRGFEFRLDFHFSIGKRNFKIDAYGLKLFGIMDLPYFYN